MSFLNPTNLMNDTFLLCANSTIGFATGYVYGYLFNANKILAAKAYAIANFAHTLLAIITFPIKSRSETAYTVINAVGTGFIATVQIITFRRLNLIAGLGTLVMSIAYSVLIINKFR